MVGLGWHMVVNRTSGQRGANEQHYDGPTLDSDVGPTIRTPEDQRLGRYILVVQNSNMTSFIDYKTNTVIKLLNMMHIVEQIINIIHK